MNKKMIVDRFKTAISGRLQKWVMWATAGKGGRYLMRGGWKRNGIGRWESPKKDDFKTYTLREALEEENFFWQTT